MNKYRIFKNKSDEYKVSKYLGFIKGWKTLDVSNEWCEWYAKDHPKVFKSKKEVESFINRENWNIVQEIII